MLVQEIGHGSHHLLGARGATSSLVFCPEHDDDAKSAVKHCSETAHRFVNDADEATGAGRAIEITKAVIDKALQEWKQELS